MNIAVKTSEIKFTPIEVSVNFTITSMNELNEFLKYDRDPGSTGFGNGDDSDTLTDLMDNICKQVSLGF